jgi:alcohol dehydrogenase class IV
VDELNALLGIPKGLAAMGVDAARLDELTAMALEDPSVGGNPVAMTAENTKALFLAAM